MAKIDAIAEGVNDLATKVRESFRYPVDAERPAKVYRKTILIFLLFKTVWRLFLSFRLLMLSTF